MQTHCEKRTWSDYFFIFLLILISDDSLLFGTNQNEKMLAFRIFFYVVVVLYLSIKLRLRYNKRAITIFLIISTCVFLTIFIYSYYTNGYIVYLLVLFLSVTVVSYYSIKQFFEIFIDVMKILSLISIISYVFYSLSPSFYSIFPTIKNLSNISYYNLLLVVQSVDAVFIRNSSLFREPGVFALYLNFTFIILLYSEVINENKNKIIVLLLLSMILTFSTAGYICCLIIFIPYLKKLNLFSTLSAFIITCIVLVFYGNLNLNVFEKFSSDSIYYESTLSRFSSFWIPLYIFSINPLIGVGLDSFTHYYSSISYNLYGIEFNTEGHSTNTILNTLAIYGIIPAFISLLCLYSFVRKIFYVKKNKFSVFVILIALFMMLSNQELRLSTLYCIILMYGAKYLFVKL